VEEVELCAGVGVLLTGGEAESRWMGLTRWAEMAATVDSVDLKLMEMQDGEGTRQREQMETSWDTYVFQWGWKE